MIILNGKQMKATDEYTIKHLPIASIDLMEKASSKCFEWLTEHISKSDTVCVICGPGNNGGDGLAIARMLLMAGFRTSCYHLINPGGTISSDCKTNIDRLKAIDAALPVEITSPAQLNGIQGSDVIVDAIFGTGLARPASGLFGEVIEFINRSASQVISIDLPSGIYSSETSLISDNHIVKSKHTLTFHCWKPALLVPENADFIGTVHVLDIGLINHPEILNSNKQYLTDEQLIASVYRPRPAFSNKGTFGHALLCAGGAGKMGAAILAARGYLKSGGGLLSMLIPDSGVKIIQTGVPEAMCLTYDQIDNNLTEKHRVIGIGPGIGTDAYVNRLMDRLLGLQFEHYVIDADGLNCIAGMTDGLDKIPHDSVLTPHPGEFKRLAGTWSNDFEKLELQTKLSAQTHSIIVLKGRYTSIACPDGTMYFNSTGNAGMAKGGSGDILTGLITGLIACKYSPAEAALMGVYLHGLAGDLAAQKFTQEAMNAGDLIDCLPEAWKMVIQSGANQ